MGEYSIGGILKQVALSYLKVLESDLNSYNTYSKGNNVFIYDKVGNIYVAYQKGNRSCIGFGVTEEEAIIGLNESLDKLKRYKNE